MVCVCVVQTNKKKYVSKNCTRAHSQLKKMVCRIQIKQQRIHKRGKGTKRVSKKKKTHKSYCFLLSKRVKKTLRDQVFCKATSAHIFKISFFHWFCFTHTLEFNIYFNILKNVYVIYLNAFKFLYLNAFI